MEWDTGITNTKSCDDTSEEDHPTVSASANVTKSFWLNDDLTWSLTLDGSADVTASSMATPPKGSIAPHGHSTTAPRK